MLNTEHAYVEAGYKCAQARLKRDESLAQHWKRWFSSAYALENETEKPYVRKLFDQGYSEAQHR
jgi:hypothetical protein